MTQGDVATSNTQAPANETKFRDAAIAFDLEQFFDNSTVSYLNTVDQYRFEGIDVYCEISNIEFNGFFRRFNIYYKDDYDDNNTITWRQLQARDCVQRKTLNPVTDTVMVKLMHIIPSADFRNTTTGSDPANAIMPARTWFDIAAPEQRFVGLKVHVEVNSGAGETSIPRISFPCLAHMAFRGQI